MTRFFVRPDQIAGGEVILDADDAHHLRAVLKALPGDEIAVLDGAGFEYPATLTQVGKSRVIAKLGEATRLETEPVCRITVAQALPKVAEKMEQVLQRGTEVGVAGYWAFASDRSLSHLTGERQEKRLTRWSSIVKTAAEQSHRALLPTLRIDGGLRDVLAASAQFDLALFAYECERDTTLRATLTSRVSCPKTILIIMGPEGGFTQSEVKAAKDSSAVAITLGPRIYRTETAALVMASQILYALEQG